MPLCCTKNYLLHNPESRPIPQSFTSAAQDHPDTSRLHVSLVWPFEMGVFWSTPPPEPHPSVVFGIDGTREDPKEWTDNKLLIHGTKGSGKSTAVKQPHSRGSSDFLASDDENLRYDFPETQLATSECPSNTPAFPLLRLPDELLRLIIGILSHGGGGGGPGAVTPRGALHTSHPPPEGRLHTHTHRPKGVFTPTPTPEGRLHTHTHTHTQLPRG